MSRGLASTAAYRRRRPEYLAEKAAPAPTREDLRDRRRRQEDSFLRSLRELGGNVRGASTAAGIHHTATYRWRRKSITFGQRMNAILDDFPDRNGIKGDHDE